MFLSLCIYAFVCVYVCVRVTLSMNFNELREEYYSIGDYNYIWTEMYAPYRSHFNAIPSIILAGPLTPTALMQFGLYGKRCRFRKAISALFGLTKAQSAF